MIPSLDPILNQFKPATTRFLDIRFNIILPSIPTFRSKFCSQFFFHLPCPTDFNSLNLFMLKVSDEEHRLFIIFPD